MKKKRFVPIAILLGVSGLAVYAAIWISLPSKLPNTNLGAVPCDRWGITFDSTSVDRIHENPESILEDPAAFWKEDPAYSLVALAPWYQDGSIPPDGWVRSIEKVQSIPVKDRHENTALARSAEIMEHAESYCMNVLPLITSVLPQDADLETTVYLSAFNDPESFALRSNIVMNAGSKSHFGKVSKFFNILSHEIFHIGYFTFQPHQIEVWPDNYPLHVILVTLQNDGIAVFLQHELQDLYPAPLEIELLLLDSKLAVKYLMGRVNKLLQNASTFDEDTSMQQAFSGLNQPALYVVGAYMADTIDGELGREALAETVATGPRSFIRAYNSVAEEGMKLHEIEEPTSLSSIQALRKAAIEGDDGKLEKILGEIRERGIQEPGGMEFETLMSTGLVLQSNGKLELSLEVIKSLVMFFPDYPFSHIYLGDLYVEQGEIEKANEAYQHAVALDSRFLHVFGRTLESD
jgi:hypothetical protein